MQPADELPGAQPVVGLAHDVWQNQFLQDPAIIGRVITVGRTARIVVGVMPPRFGYEGGFSVMAVGAGYHDASESVWWPAVTCRRLTPTG